MVSPPGRPRGLRQRSLGLGPQLGRRCLPEGDGELVERRVPLAGAGPGHRHARGHDRAPGRRLEVEPTGEGGGQGAVEGVAGTGRVDRLHLRRLDVDHRAVAPDEHRAARTQRDQDRLRGARALARRLEQRPGGLDRVLDLGHVPSRPARILGGQQCELAAVGHHDVGEGDHGPVEAAGRCRVEDRPGTALPPDAERLARGLGRDLVGDDDDVARVRVEPAERLPDVGGGQAGVRPRGHGDLVLGLGVHEDQRDARRRVVERDQDVRADSLAGQRRARIGAELVVAERGNEHDRDAEPRGRHGLVAALAAVEARERAAEHGLAGLRQPLGLHHQVDVDGSDDQDPTAHRLASPCLPALTDPRSR